MTEAARNTSVNRLICMVQESE